MTTSATAWRCLWFRSGDAIATISVLVAWSISCKSDNVVPARAVPRPRRSRRGGHADAHLSVDPAHPLLVERFDASSANARARWFSTCRINGSSRFPIASIWKLSHFTILAWTASRKACCSRAAPASRIASPVYRLASASCYARASAFRVMCILCDCSRHSAISWDSSLSRKPSSEEQAKQFRCDACLRPAISNPRSWKLRLRAHTIWSTTASHIAELRSQAQYPMLFAKANPDVDMPEKLPMDVSLSPEPSATKAGGADFPPPQYCLQWVPRAMPSHVGLASLPSDQALEYQINRSIIKQHPLVCNIRGLSNADQSNTHSTGS